MFKASILTLLAIVSFTYSEAQLVDAPYTTLNPEQINRPITAPVPPESFTLFGEEMPLQKQDVFERFDRQLLVNSNLFTGNLYNMKLAARWLPMIEHKLDSAGIPEDFKYLCIAESALQNLISRVGATGFWQFMKGTAPGYGLLVNSEVDERYNPVKSTDAAIKYLKQAYNKFGNWTAAAASYNCGMGGYNGAATRQGSKIYYDLWLPDETMQYIFRIAAIKQIMENPEAYNFHLDSSQLYYPYSVRRIPVKQAIPNLVTFARAQGTDYKTIRILNPWIRSSGLSSTYGGRLEILVPAEGVEVNTSENAAD